MISMDTFLLGLMIVSTLTSLTTEALKKVFAESDKKVHSNTLAGIVAAVLSAVISIGYAVFTSTSITPQIIVCIIALVFMSWLCAMVGYDKVVSLFKSKTKDDE